MNKKMIPYGKQSLNIKDFRKVLKVLKSDFITQGPLITKFENELCYYTGAKYCVAVSSGTAALHIAVKALDIQNNLEGITSPISFVASANCLVYNNIKPVFADIDLKTYNITAKDISKKINKNTKIIIPVHFAGQPCDMQAINDLRLKNNIFIIEDASHAIGSRYKDGSRVGCCRYSDMAIFSFHPVKNMTTGEGGAITTNDKDIYEKLVMLRSHGITKDNEKLLDNPGPWYYEMHELGYNYRITDIQAALGLSQLKRLDKFIKRRRDIVNKYNQAFESIEWLKTPYEDENVYSAFHLYILLIDFNKIGKTRKSVMEDLISKGIKTQVHYIPIYIQPYYKKNYGYNWGECINAEKYYNAALSIPLYPAMSNRDINYIIREIKSLEG